MVTEKEMIELDYDGMSDYEIMVLLIVDGKERVSKSRLQRIYFLYEQLQKSKKEGVNDC